MYELLKISISMTKIKHFYFHREEVSFQPKLCIIPISLFDIHNETMIGDKLKKKNTDNLFFYLTASGRDLKVKQEHVV